MEDVSERSDSIYCHLPRGEGSGADRSGSWTMLPEDHWVLNELSTSVLWADKKHGCLSCLFVPGHSLGLVPSCSRGSGVPLCHAQTASAPSGRCWHDPSPARFLRWLRRRLRASAKPCLVLLPGAQPAAAGWKEAERGAPSPPATARHHGRPDTCQRCPLRRALHGGCCPLGQGAAAAVCFSGTAELVPTDRLGSRCFVR